MLAARPITATAAAADARSGMLKLTDKIWSESDQPRNFIPIAKRSGLQDISGSLGPKIAQP